MEVRLKDAGAWSGRELCSDARCQPELRSGAGLDSVRRKERQPFHGRNKAVTPGTLTHLERLEAKHPDHAQVVAGRTTGHAVFDRQEQRGDATCDSVLPGEAAVSAAASSTRWKLRDDRVRPHGEGPRPAARSYEPPDVRGYQRSHGSAIHTDVMKTQALKQALSRCRFDAAFGGPACDGEEPRQGASSRSARPASLVRQPELWSLYNAQLRRRASACSMSNWTGSTSALSTATSRSCPAAERPVIDAAVR